MSAATTQTLATIEPLTRSVLDAHPCNCGRATCDGSVTLRAKCHRDAGVRVTYQPATGCATLVCLECGFGIALLQLAAEVPS